MKTEKGVCLVDGCTEFVIAKGLCAKHYKRFQRHGETKQTRAKDWGARERHPLYRQWCGLMRYHKLTMTKEWIDFWVFVDDVKNKPDEGKCRLQKIDATKPFGPNNFYWQLIDTSADTKVKRQQRNDYQKAYRALHMEKAQNSSLKKNYGITLEDWNRMYKEQNGVCKICGKPETKIDRRIGVARRLSVDHCHDTGRVRGLLCSDCNTAIGNFKHNPELIRQAAKYCEEN